MQILIRLLLVAVAITGAAAQASKPAPQLQDGNRLGGFAYKEPKGWHWYNEDEEKKRELEQHQAPPPPPKPKQWTEENATEFRQALTKALNKAKDKAIMFPSAENFAEYKRLQDFLTHKAGLFANSSREAMLKYPELDYSIQHPHSNGAQQYVAEQKTRDQQQAIKDLTRENGLFFFYNGRHPIEVAMAGIVKMFAQEHELDVVMISKDGEIPADMPETRIDTGQADAMNVKYTPALFLVNPKTLAYQPLSYGYKAMDALAVQFRLVATGFEPDF